MLRLQVVRLGQWPTIVGGRVKGVLPKSISASDVGQTFLSAGSGDFPVPGFRVKLSASVGEVEKLRNRQARKPALQFGQHALDTPTNDGRANLPVCPNLPASQRSNAGGTLGRRTREHRSARSCGSLGGASAYVSLQRDKAAPPYLGGGVRRSFGTRTRVPPAKSKGSFALASHLFVDTVR